MGTGGVKVGGNYAASLLPHELAVEQSSTTRKFADAIYLDPKTHTKIEEVGGELLWDYQRQQIHHPDFRVDFAKYYQILIATPCSRAFRYGSD